METTALTMFTNTIHYSGECIFVKPVCDFFNLDYQNQVEKIKNDRVLAKSYGKNRNNLLFGDNYPRVSLSKKGFLMWVLRINANTVIEHLREKFICYQELVTDFLYGTYEESETLKIQYSRLKRLRKLYSKVGLEIQRVQNVVTRMLDERYEQHSIDFTENTPIN